jgi:hypothetical protein
MEGVEVKRHVFLTPTLGKGQQSASHTDYARGKYSRTSALVPEIPTGRMVKATRN